MSWTELSMDYLKKNHDVSENILALPRTVTQVNSWSTQDNTCCLKCVVSNVISAAGGHHEEWFESWMSGLLES